MRKARGQTQSKAPSRLLSHSCLKLLPPIADRLKSRQAAGMCLNPSPEIFVRQRQIYTLPARLLNVPWCVDKDLDAIAFRIPEVNRERISVGDSLNIRCSVCVGIGMEMT